MGTGNSHVYPFANLGVLSWAFIRKHHRFRECVTISQVTNFSKPIKLPWMRGNDEDCDQDVVTSTSRE